MPYDEQLAARIRRILHKRKGVTEKKMFGGLSFLLNGKMCCGVLRNDLVVRIHPDH
jgi:TfoX/Sxy family transcriptional regulator of competence genes